jgi:hypothetical protein
MKVPVGRTPWSAAGPPAGPLFYGFGCPVLVGPTYKPIRQRGEAA